jgi:hypothetical protein
MVTLEPSAFDAIAGQLSATSALNGPKTGAAALGLLVVDQKGVRLQTSKQPAISIA